MSYRSDTIATMVLRRVNQNHFLPAIQREFVWAPRQVSTLFDSLMREYPIGSFLFWELEPENYEEWETYKFLENTSEKGARNEPAKHCGRSATHPGSLRSAASHCAEYRS